MGLFNRIRNIFKSSLPPIVMYDSTNINAIPANAALVASYVDRHDMGPLSDFDYAVRRFGAHKCVSITISNQDAEVADVEPGAMSASQLPGWVARQKARGVSRPVVYSDRSDHPACFAEVGNQVSYWIADPIGVPLTLPGADAVQYQFAGGWDASWVLPSFPFYPGAPKPPPPPPSDLSMYKNPLRGIKNLVPERIDQGVDYAGSGPLYSIGPGVVLNTLNSGWPGGAFISVKLTAGKYAGKVFYFAENIKPLVHVGQIVNADTVLGTLVNSFPNSELGWATADGKGESLARAAGQIATSGDPGGVSSAYGVAFSDFLHYLGAPAGVKQAIVKGTIDPSYTPPLRPGPGPGPEPTLMLGSTGAAVVEVQTLLNQKDNAGLIVDGIFGPATLAAVKTYQSLHHITVTGIVGPTTWNSLVPPVVTPTPEPVLRMGSVGAAVSLLQSLLNKNGAKLVVDGSFGPNTFAAVEAFQTKKGLVVDGVVGPATWGKLGNYS